MDTATRRRDRASKDSIPEIVAYIRGRFTDMIWVGKDYAIDDLCADLERIQAGFNDDKRTLEADVLELQCMLESKPAEKYLLFPAIWPPLCEAIRRILRKTS